MTFAAGSRLGPYEILAPLGAGGMGEVYRARDSKLDREVAVKVLPESVAKDHETLARFEREAKAVEYGDDGLSQIVTDNLFDKIHKGPRWLPFLRKIGYAPEQLATIDFKVTLPK